MIIFAVSPIIQKELVDTLCFGSCGKILCGGIDCGIAGPCFPCNQEVCPHEKGRMEIGDVNGKKIFIRALQNTKCPECRDAEIFGDTITPEDGK